MNENGGTRRGFIAAAAATAIGSTAFATLHSLTGASVGPGVVMLMTPPDELTGVDLLSTDAWMSAIGSTVEIHGEHGVATAQVLSVTPAEAGGARPEGVRKEPLTVLLDTDPDGAPDGDATYDLGSPIGGLDALFLQRGNTVFGRAVLVAILN